jgi:type I site-specific restriction endonuclease
VFASNGDGFVQHDRTGQSEQRETTLALDAFPSPEELWRRYSRWKGFTPQQEKVVLQPYYDGGSRKDPRYYQINAIQATVEAITKGQQRILLVMATGTAVKSMALACRFTGVLLGDINLSSLGELHDLSDDAVLGRLNILIADGALDFDFFLE